MKIAISTHWDICCVSVRLEVLESELGLESGFESILLDLDLNLSALLSSLFTVL